MIIILVGVKTIHVQNIRDSQALRLLIKLSATRYIIICYDHISVWRDLYSHFPRCISQNRSIELFECGSKTRNPYDLLEILEVFQRNSLGIVLTVLINLCLDYYPMNFLLLC